MQNRTKFRHFLPKRGRSWHKIDVFRDRFYENGPRPARGAIPAGADTNGRQAGSITRVPQHGLAGRRSGDFTSGWAICMYTDMVKLRRLTQRVNRHFHHPNHGFGGGPVLQINGLFEQVSVVGRFLAYQILPNFTNFYQKCVAKGVRRASKRQLTGGFSRAIYLNRVKSGGSCQAIIGDGRRVRPALPEGSCDGKSRLRRGRRPHRKSALPRSGRFVGTADRRPAEN